MLLPHERDRSIRAEDERWDELVIPDLKVLALRALALNWKDHPVLEKLPTCTDKDLLLEILPIDLPFQLVVTRIPDGFYWERIARDRYISSKLLFQKRRQNLPA